MIVDTLEEPLLVVDQARLWRHRKSRADALTLSSVVAILPTMLPLGEGAA